MLAMNAKSAPGPAWCARNIAGASLHQQWLKGILLARGCGTHAAANFAKFDIYFKRCYVYAE
jgi:hypothetical protein